MSKIKNNLTNKTIIMISQGQKLQAQVMLLLKLKYLNEFKKNKKFLIIGGTGFLGYFISKRLISSNIMLPVYLFLSHQN